MMLSKNSSASRRKPLPQFVVPVGIENAVGRGRRQIPQIEQLRSEVADESVGSRVGEHAPHLLLQHTGIAELLLTGEVDQLVVRNAAPEEERQTRSQLQVADAIRLTGGHVRWLLFSAHEKLRARQQPPKRQLDAVVERAGDDVLRSRNSSATRRPVPLPDADTRAAPAWTGSLSRTVPPGRTFVGRQVNTLRRLRESVGR